MNNLTPEEKFFEMLMPLDKRIVKMGKTIKSKITNGMIQVRKEDKNVRIF